LRRFFQSAFVVFFIDNVVYSGNFLVFIKNGARNSEDVRMTNRRRVKVRAENPSGACGKLDHMTIDELKARAVGDDFDGTCPACGKFHLTRAEIEKLEKTKVVDSESYKAMKIEAEASE
jgi:hypothetical protein